MQSRDLLVRALQALCEREGGYRAVADAARISADNLWQILHGTKLPSGKQRSVGSRLAAKLDARFPGWMHFQAAGEGVNVDPVAQTLSLTPDQTSSMPVHDVPVIGTLALGEDYMFELHGLPGGQPIGFVPAFSERGATFAVQIHGDSLYPAVRHGACLVVEARGTPIEGELALIETVSGQYWVCELVAVRADSVIAMPANGGQRRTFPATEVAACMPVCDIIPGHRLTRRPER